MKTNDIFDIKRFGRYLLADGRSCVARFGIYDLLATSCIGVVFYLFTFLFRMLHLWNVSFTSMGSVFVLGIVMLVVCLILGSRCYGHVTEKNAGSQFVLLPVSPLEKTLSILVWSFLIPVAVLVMYLGFDWILSLLDPNYGKSLVYLAFSANSSLSELFNEIQAAGGPDISYIRNPFTWIGDMMNIVLAFVLGALVFKKSKVGKTFLVIIAVSIVLSSIVSPFVANELFDEINVASDYLVNIDGTINYTFPKGIFFRNIFLWDTLADILVLIGLSVAIFFRIKTIKH